MSMTVVVTRNVPSRFRGFLASCMCELAPGVYTAPRLRAGVRERVWTVLEGWWAAYPDASVVMTWPDRTMPGGQNLRMLGTPIQELREHHGVFLARREHIVAERVEESVDESVDEPGETTQATEETRSEETQQS